MSGDSNQEFRKLKKKYRRDPNKVLHWVSKDGMNLEHALVQTKEIVYMAVSNNGLALQFADKFNNDATIVFTAIAQNSEAYQFVGDTVKKHVDMSGIRFIKPHDSEPQETTKKQKLQKIDDDEEELVQFRKLLT